jgi:hypothetical protein
MDKFPNANIGFSSQNIIDCTGVESYHIVMNILLTHV